MSDEHEVHHEDPGLAQDAVRLEPPETMGGWPVGRIRFYEDEAGAVSRGGKSNALGHLIGEMLAKGRRVAPVDLKADPELGERLTEKREEIERDLPGLFAGQDLPGEHIAMTGHGRQWQWRGKSALRIRDPEEEFPVRVGDVVRIIDLLGEEKPFPGHVVDITGWWITVASRLGDREKFYGQHGYAATGYRYRLEPYVLEMESER